MDLQQKPNPQENKRLHRKWNCRFPYDDLDELDLCVRLAAVSARNPAIGYESSNHYFYNRQMLLKNTSTANICKKSYVSL
ncbi:MAG: hypothetical protein ACOX6S_10585 [Clostridia bacterium]